jgi:hypothetical protein
MGKKHKLLSKPYTALKKEKKLLGRATTGPCFLIENYVLSDMQPDDAINKTNILYILIIPNEIYHLSSNVFLMLIF